MKANEKALELIDNFTMDNTRDGERNGIKCALIAVDLVIEELEDYTGLSRTYWEEVKQEIKQIQNL